MEYVSLALAVVMLGVVIWMVALQRRALEDLKAAASAQAAVQNLQTQVDGLRSQLLEGIHGTGTLVTSMNQQLTGLSGTVGQHLTSITAQLQNSSGQIGQRLDNAAKVIGEVQQRLGQLSQATAQVIDSTKAIQSLQDLLKPPKMRGDLGETLLETLLGQVLPPKSFATQHAFRSGEKVDAVVRLSEGMVPIDAKFPIESFRRILDAKEEAEKRAARREFTAVLRKHIDAISRKYILPDEGTFNFALMYVPAENIYYETLVKDDADVGVVTESLSEYARKKNVIPVSPSTLYVYLQTVGIGLRGMQVEEQAKEILGLLARLQGDLAKFRQEYDMLGTHLKNAQQKYDESGRRLTKFEDKLCSAAGEPGVALQAPEDRAGAA